MFKKEKEHDDYRTVLWARILCEPFFHTRPTLSSCRQRFLACISSASIDPACREDVSRWIHVAEEARMLCIAPRRRHRSDSRTQEGSPRKRPHVSAAFPYLHFLRAQRHSEMTQKRFCFLFVLGAGYDSNRDAKYVL